MQPVLMNIILDLKKKKSFLVASSNVNNGTMNIGKSGQKYNNNKNKKPIAGDNFFKIANPKSEKGVQTDKDITEESGGFKAEATTTKKFEIIGTNPALFDFVDEWVREISVKRLDESCISFSRFLCELFLVVRLIFCFAF